MTNKFLNLIKWEITITHKIHNVIKYLLCFFLFCSFSLLLISTRAEIENFGMIFIVISLPLSMLAFANLILKPDYNDGSLELLLINFTPFEIAFAKYLSLSLCCFYGVLINFPIMLIFFNIEFWQALYSMISLCLTLLLAANLTTLIGAMQCYFQTNTNYLSILVMPLLIPSIVISGIMLTDPQKQYLNYILLSIDLIIIPSALYFISYLIKNIYHI